VPPAGGRNGHAQRRRARESRRGARRPRAFGRRDRRATPCGRRGAVRCRAPHRPRARLPPRRQHEGDAQAAHHPAPAASRRGACAMPIPWRYPLVEAITAALLALAWLEFGPTPEFVVAASFLAALVAITVIDLRHQIIPDAITLPGILAGITANVATRHLSWADVALG